MGRRLLLGTLKTMKRAFLVTILLFLLTCYVHADSSGIAGMWRSSSGLQVEVFPNYQGDPDKLGISIHTGGRPLNYTGRFLSESRFYYTSAEGDRIEGTLEGEVIRLRNPETGWTATWTAAGDVFTALGYGNSVRARTLIKKDPAVLKSRKDVGRVSGATPLHVAASLPDQLEIVKLILDHDIAVDIRTGDRMTALHLACMHADNLEVIGLLLERGADINAVDADGMTPLDWSIRTEHLKAAEFLRQKGGREGQ
jgi:hypothetical protein